MSSQATVSGKIGPGNTITSKVYTDVIAFSVDIINGILQLTLVGGIIKEAIDISAATSFTVTISSGVYTITIS